MNQELYSVLLVEDEASIREGIRDTIPWDELGYRFECEAKDGNDALKKYDQFKPDLIITDIHMPKMNGLELVSAIRKRGDEVKVVILTGFDDFNYARAALKMNVSDYLLKPVSPTELVDMLVKVKCHLDDMKSSDQSGQSESQNLLRRMALLKLISGINDSKIIESNLSSDDVILKASWFSVVLYDSDTSHRSFDPDSYRDRFLMLVPDDCYCELIPDNTGKLIEILYKTSIGNDDTDIRACIRHKREYVSDHTHESITAGIGMTVNSITQIQDSYNSAELMLSKRFIHGGGIEYGHDGESDISELKVNSEMIDQYLKSVETGHIDEWQNLLASIAKKLIECSVSEMHGREIMILIVSTMMNTLRRQNLISGLNHVIDTSIIQKMGTYKLLNEMLRWLSEVISGITFEIVKNKDNSSFDLAERAKEYIKRHYADSEMSQDDVCSHLGVSISTFCRVFKTYHDMTFSAFLTETRIRMARRLIMNTDLRNKEIAFQVGFNSPHYFSHVFTKHVGYSPSAYRKSLVEQAAGRSVTH